MDVLEDRAARLRRCWANRAPSPQPAALFYCGRRVGPFFGYSDTWQLIVNTGTTIVTFLMVFLVQNTQNRDARALHLKLDELLRSVKPARNKLIDLENCSDEEIEHIARAISGAAPAGERASEGDPAGQTSAGLNGGAIA